MSDLELINKAAISVEKLKFIKRNIIGNPYALLSFDTDILEQALQRALALCTTAYWKPPTSGPSGIPCYVSMGTGEEFEDKIKNFSEYVKQVTAQTFGEC